MRGHFLVRTGAIFLVFGLAVASFVGGARSTLAAAFPQGKEEQSENNAQKQPDAKSQPQQAGPDAERSLKRMEMDFLSDQKAIWTSQAKLRPIDAEWLLPLGGVASAFFVTDKEFSKHLSHDPKTISHYKTYSDAGLGAMIGAAGGMWVLGHFRHDAHWSETGFLSGEAVVNSLVVVEGLKYTLRRQRPFEGNGSGPFFSGGTSFPSEHSAAVWAVAGIVSHEYPGPFTKILAYGLASFVSISRVRARQHFNSDIYIGGLLGNLIAQDIYSRHYDPELGGGEWHSLGEIVRNDVLNRPRFPGSPYVPIESWVYPAIERLAAEGFIDTVFLGSRPWTRIECARLVKEAGDRIEGSPNPSSEPERLYEALSTEFRSDLEAIENGSENAVKLESLYTNSTEIVGRPLNDSNHFGQTIINNYGRPYQQGFNTVDGFSGWAADGRFTVYVRGEYQHSPSSPGLSQLAEDVIAAVDVNPVQAAAPIPRTNQFRLLDTYVSAALGGWNLGFGKQSLWWGVGEGGPLIFSNNAAPIYMFRASRVVPISLPWLFRYMGPVKMEAFMGKLSGNEFPPRPVLHGEKISFKPTRNLELGFTRMAEMGGVGRALTPAAFWNSYVSPRESNFYGSNENPGKRTAGFEFSYRVPFLRDWLTLYSDSLSADDVSPISAPRRAAVSPGIYFTHFPKLPKLDLRVEAVDTNTTISSTNGQFVYYDHFYHDLSTNNKNIIGSWIGREGQGLQAWTTYWLNSRSHLQFGYRHAKVANDFIPGGETLNDGFVKANWWVRNNLDVSAFVQYEKWLAPVLTPGPQTNWTSSVQISFQPRGLGLPIRSNRQGQDQGTTQATKDAKE